MRFSNANYLKAFPRENKKPVKVEVVAGNVIEEAEQLKRPEPKEKQILKDSEPEAGDVTEGASEAEIREGVE